MPALAGLGDIPERLARLREHSHAAQGSARDELAIAGRSKTRSLRDSKTSRDALDAYRKQSQWNETAALDAAAHGLRFARLALAAREEYAKAKRVRVGLDFDDLLIKTRDLLHDSDEVRAWP